MRKPLVELDCTTTGRVFIGVTYFDENDYGVRASVLSDAGGYVVDRIMEKRFYDMVDLMAGNADFVCTENYHNRFAIRTEWKEKGLNSKYFLESQED